MAIYHSSTNVHSRGKGHSAVAAAAYRSGEKLYDERTGDTYDWSRYREKNGEVLASEIFLPDGADEKYRNRETLWNGAEDAEKTKAGAYKKTAAIAREIENSLPFEMSHAQRQRLAEAHAFYLTQRYGVAVDMNIHAPHPGGNQKNYHVHYLLTTRKLEQKGFTEKCELELDGKTKKARGFGTGKEQIEELRKDWADHVNAALERGSYEQRVDHRSLKDQGIDRKPTMHMGPKAADMERRGERSRIGDENRAVEMFNRELAELQWQESIIDAAIDAEKQRMAEQNANQRETRGKAKKGRNQYFEEANRRAFNIKNRTIEETPMEQTNTPQKKAPDVEQTPSPSPENSAETWDRDQTNRQWEESIIDAAIQEDERRRHNEAKQGQKKNREAVVSPDPSRQEQQWAETLKKHAEQHKQRDKTSANSYAATLDPLREMEDRHDKSRLRLEATLKESYNRSEQERLLSAAQDRAEKADTALGRAMGWRKAALEEAQAHQKTLESITQRETEQRQALETKNLAERQQAGYDHPAPAMKPQEPDFNLQDHYEQAATPAPEIEQTDPAPQFDNASEMRESYEKSATNDNAPEPERQPEQEQSRDLGGYER